MPFALLTMLTRPKEGLRSLAESVFAGLLAIAALFTIYSEGTIIWQSDWTCVMYLLLAATLWRARAAQNP